MRNFKIADIECGTSGYVDEEFYDARKPEAERIRALYGDNGLIMLNRDLMHMNNRMVRLKDKDEDLYKNMAGQVRALRIIIQEVM